jgi:2,3-bisphosphoglycerate-dependent phosphoglycerate mutase
MSAKNANLKIYTDERLRERQKGDGGNNHGMFQKRWADFNFHEQGGESLAMVQRRNMDALFDILANHKDKNIVVGTHGTALSTILNYYNPSFGCEDFLRIIDFMPYIIRLDFDGETFIKQEELLIIEKEFVGTNRADKPTNVIIVALKAIIVFNGKALIIQRSSDDEVGAETWEFAGGKLDFGEDLEASLKRKVQEEVGLDVSVDKLLYATTFKTHEYRQMVILAYICTAVNDKVLLSAEHQDYLWASKKQILEMFPKPLIANLNQYDVWGNACID